MRKMTAWLGLIGGLLWAAKSAYDWLGLGRVINTGYPPSDPTDYVRFLTPLLCTGALYVLARRFRGLGKAPLVLSIGLLMTAGFHISETYFMDSNIPSGLVFLLAGNLLLLFGTLWLALRIKKEPSIPRPLLVLVIALFLTTCLFCLSPFMSGSVSNDIATAITVSLMILTGMIWAGIGGVLIVTEKSNPAAG